MKKIIFTVLLLPIVCIAFAQQYRLALQLDHEWKQRGDDNYMEFTANNEDYCTYTLLFDLSNYGMFRGAQTRTSANIRPGHNSFLRLTPSGGASHLNAQYSYKVFRGSLNEKVNPDFNYALPVKSGNEVRVFEKLDSDYTLVFDLNNTTTDTIYASRAGVVCSDNLTDHSAKGHDGFRGRTPQITIYHKDGSFGEYKGFTTPLVSAGTKVEMGTPIAIVQKEGENPKIVEFAVYFLDENKVKNEETGSKHSHLRPFFNTSNGNMRLEQNVSYIAEHTDEMIFQDMSKREINNYKKKK